MGASQAEKVTPDFANAIKLTGTTSQATSDLVRGQWYTVYVGDTAVTITIADSATADADDPILGAYVIHSFNLDAGNQIALFPADGSSTFTAHVVPSSPGAGLA